METCAACGATVAAGEAEWSADGLRCRRCSLQAEVVGHVRAAVVAEAVRRRRRLGNPHLFLAFANGAVWSLMAIAFGYGVRDEPYRGWTWPLVAVSLSAAAAIGLRLRWAFVATVALDLVAVAAPLVAAARADEHDAWLGAGLVAAIPLLLLVATLSLKRRRVLTTEDQA